MVSFAVQAEPFPDQAKVLDDFESLKPWTTFASDQVTASLRQVDGTTGKAMCLAYDFHGVSGGLLYLYRSAESLYYRYPPEMRIPVYNKQWHNFYPEERRYHWGKHFMLDVF